jgi:nucleoside-diphosphate-sugar epimerase
MPVAPALLLTGATGMVGREVLNHILAARPNRQVVTLTRHLARELTRTSSAGLHVHALLGDVRRSDLGLSDKIRSELRKTVSEIIHCAADTRFGQELRDARSANANGTQNVLNFALSCPKIEKVAVVSTVFVVGRSAGYFTESRQLLVHRKFSNSYQQSKCEAEQFSFEMMDRIPIAIFRFSTIIGDSRTGFVRQFNYFHKTLKLLPRNVLPVAPGEPNAPIDLVPTDWAGAAFSYLFDKFFAPGRVYHLCAGPSASLTVAQMLELTLQLFESNPRARKFLPIRAPVLVSLQEYDKYVVKCISSGDPIMAEVLRVLGYSLPHLGIFQAFDNSRTLQDLTAGQLEPPPILDYYPKVLNHCIDTSWGLSNYRPC